ncbi:hemerythrin family protein [Nitrogeniibacter mangrovi]|uniref:Hemerythrin family protein n=1 Tax=Nitrogeniibacter mangrovi TaxID=2016596 RepID=A0A6C1B3F2_9RHOO|nr:bacteriohemerythrin [Nitrogeniibacter mangrovi]QID16734.1 hemerythrin family protein [Nitrogeniibacter mangrovi]
MDLERSPQDGAPIVWEAGFETGIADMDEQHHILIDTLNEAQAKLRGEVRHEAIDQLLRDLLAYALYHFEAEEAMMQAADYAARQPETADAHVAQHREFAARIVAFRDRFTSTGELDREALLAFLGTWLREHILGIDQALARFIHAHPV